MRRLRIVVVAAALACLLPAPAPAQVEPGQALVVAFHLRASQRDSVTACQEAPLERGDAEALGEAVARAIPLPGTRTVHDRGAACLSLAFDGPLTGPARRGERMLRVDASGLAEVRERLGYRELFVVVCIPRLTGVVSVRTGDGPRPAQGCESGGYVWRVGEALDVDVVVRATASDVARGLLAAGSWWVALLTAAWIAFMFFGKRYHWRLFRRHPSLGGGVVALGGVLAGFGWSRVAYESGLVHAMQTVAGIGVGGEAALVGVPALLGAAVVAATGTHIARDAARAFPIDGAPAPPAEGVPDPGGPPALPLIPPYPAVRRAPRAMLWAYAPAISLAVAFLVLAIAPANLEVKVEGMLAASVAFALAVRGFPGGILPAVYGASRLEPHIERAVVEEARASGARIARVWSSPVPPAAVPVGGGIVLAGRSAIVWEPLTGLPPAQLGAAIALRGTRARGWPLALGGTALSLFTIFFTRAEGIAVPMPAVLLPVAAMCAIAFLDALEFIRIRTSARSGVRAEEHLRGLLTAARTHARLAASGALTPSDVVLPGLALSVWERAIRLAGRVADDAGLEPGAAGRAADAIVAAESPAPPEPEPKPLPPAKKPAAKKKTATTTAAARKKRAATRPASARSTRRPRP